MVVPSLFVVPIGNEGTLASRWSPNLTPPQPNLALRVLTT
jgi:hypothetical protein